MNKYHRKNVKIKIFTIFGNLTKTKIIIENVDLPGLVHIAFYLSMSKEFL